MAKRIQDPPALDTKTFVARIRDMAAKIGLGPFSVFDDSLPRFHRWIRAEGEFDGDGKGVADTVNAHAVQINAHEARLDADAVKLQGHDSRLDVLEARPASGGQFP